MAEIHRLRSCRRCRRTFVGRPNDLYCPDCRQQLRRERRMLRVSGVWEPVLLYGALSVGLGLATGLLHPAYAAPATWVGALAALIQLGRRL